MPSNFITVGSYLTDTEHKIRSHVFLRHWVDEKKSLTANMIWKQPN